MPSPILLSKLSHEFGKTAIDGASGQSVFDVSSSHALIQAAGYLKYMYARDQNKSVYFRGQNKLFTTLSPSLFRGIKEGPPAEKRRERLKDFLSSIKSNKKALRAVHHKCHEPLLQHYGINTTWLDVVDNIWIALWFACFIARSIGREESYLHFEKRVPNYRDRQEYAYILLLASAGFRSVGDLNGHWVDSESETVDLRFAVPSQFVRPHAQHGILVRKISIKSNPVVDNTSLHVGTIRVPIESALDWLGDASTLTTHCLFPPAFFDYGYRELLNYVKPTNPVLGAINRIQP